MKKDTAQALPLALVSVHGSITLSTKYGKISFFIHLGEEKKGGRTH